MHRSLVHLGCRRCKNVDLPTNYVYTCSTLFLFLCCIVLKVFLQKRDHGWRYPRDKVNLHRGFYASILLSLEVSEIFVPARHSKKTLKEMICREYKVRTRNWKETQVHFFLNHQSFQCNFVYESRVIWNCLWNWIYFFHNATFS